MIVEKFGLPAIAEAGKAAFAGLMGSVLRDGPPATEQNAMLSAWAELDVEIAEAAGGAALAAHLHNTAAAMLEEVAGGLRTVAQLVGAEDA